MAETKPTYKGQGPLLGGPNALFWCRKKSVKKDQVSCNFTAFGSEGLSNRAKCPRWKGGWKHWSKSPRAVLWLVHLTSLAKLATENQWTSSSLITQKCKYLMIFLIEKIWYVRFNHYRRASFLVTGGLGVLLRTARWFHVLPAPAAGGFTWSATTCGYLHEPVKTCYNMLIHIDKGYSRR